MSTEQNKEVARQLIETVINRKNVNLVEQFLAADFIEHEELPPGLPTGREGTKILFTMLHSAFPDLKATINDLIAEGDKVVANMTWTGTQEGEFMGMPPSGNRMSIGVIDIYRVVGGQIKEHGGLTDTMAMMQQLGAMPAPE
jgi:steroid delta-isomerase-like uncharacterized protein